MSILTIDLHYSKLIIQMFNKVIISIGILALFLMGGCASAGDENVEKNAEQLEIILALEADMDYGAYLAGQCQTCHTPSGNNETIPQIHGKNKEELISALLEYLHKQRKNEVMQGVVAGLGNEEIASLTEFFSQQ